MNHFDNDVLFKHMTEKHETCFLCERNGVQFQYYRDYAKLEDHFRSDHLACEHPDCIAKRFVAFDSEVDMNAHNLQAHAGQMSRFERKQAARIEMNFTVRGSTADSNYTNASGSSNGSK